MPVRKDRYRPLHTMRIYLQPTCGPKVYCIVKGQIRLLGSPVQRTHVPVYLNSFILQKKKYNTITNRVPPGSIRTCSQRLCYATVTVTVRSRTTKQERSWQYVI
jgi:hypothetical protein